MTLGPNGARTAFTKQTATVPKYVGLGVRKEGTADCVKTGSREVGLRARTERAYGVGFEALRGHPCPMGWARSVKTRTGRITA